jgi:hypothetical protein
MVGHQTITPYLHILLATPVFKQFQIIVIILIIEEYVLPTVPSLGYVMRVTG